MVDNNAKEKKNKNQGWEILNENQGDEFEF